MEGLLMRERGVTLLETVIAMVVIAFGLLAMGRLQMGMALGAEHARSRTEALQHARTVMEGLRARPYVDMAAGADVPPGTGSVAYERSWTVDGSIDQRFKHVGVAVRWLDRRGDPQSVTLASLVADADIASGPGLALIAAQGSARVLSRHTSVPADAVPLRGTDAGRSAAPWLGASGGVLDFDNTTGEVVAQCAAMPDGATGDRSCAAMQAYLLEGYIEGRGLASVAIVFDRMEHAQTEPECTVNDAVDARTGRRLPQTRRYRCLIQPGDHDRQPATAPVWSGRVRLGGVGSGATVCRYVPADSGIDTGPDADTYTLVDRSLDHQNYAVVASSVCPRGAVPLAAA
jgi:type II secretory pathway pseudopilin PulG